ncbi:class I SAM-dependent methyltransferase [Variovorax sp. CCNWLW225]|jgi:SAM-dependent methyltransferase
MKKYMKQQMAFNSSRLRLDQENLAFSRAMPAGSLMLDAGAGDAPYKHLFEHVQYESADFEMVDKPYAKSTYVCDLKAIPVEAGRYDFIVFNQVMEHLPEPALVLQELFRVLKPGGRLIYTAPLFYEEHEQPYDFFRYTQFGVRYLFEGARFEIERLDWLEGYFGTLGYQLNCAARYLPSTAEELGTGWKAHVLAPVMYLMRGIFALLGIFFHRLEARKMFTARGYPKNYVAIARKPLASS